MMDVVFHEDSMHFSYESKFKGENPKEIKTLYYDLIECNYKINEENDDVGQSDDSGASLGHDEHLEAKGEIEAGDEHLEAEGEIEVVDVSPSIEEPELLTNIPH